VIEVDHQNCRRRAETLASLKFCIQPEHSNVVSE
jgi:hypothetical protein